ncbi:hypothetical protein R3P38DRAFT_2354713, partial [Favolaschia claudopus]
SDSITSWFPNEILSAIMQFCDPKDLPRLCLTSHLLKNIATRLLYHSVSLSDAPRVALFVRTLQEGPGSALALLVRTFSV